MTTIDVLKKRAITLAGSPAPGDARGTARVVSDLCSHVETLQDAVTELIKQLQVAKQEIAELRQAQQTGG
jgi:hypothetical protein